MWVYWLILCAVIIFYPFCVKHIQGENTLSVTPQDSRVSKSYFIVISLLMIAVIGLRDRDVGLDTNHYNNIFNSLANRDFDYLFDPILDETGREKGFVFIQILLNKLNIPFEGFNIIYAVFNISVISLFIYKKSNIVWLSYFLYIAFGMFVLDMTMVRQITAMSIVILAVMYDKNETLYDFIKFAVIVYLASLIHSSAIICIPVWFIFKIPYNTKTLLAAFCIVAVSYMAKSYTVQFVSQFATNISDRYENAAAAMQEGDAGLKLYLMILATVLLGSFKNGFLQDKFNLKMHYLLILMLILFPAVQGGGAIMRAYYYFYIFMIVYIPNMLNGLREGSDRPIYIIVVSLYIGVGLAMYISSIINDGYGVVPYEFFWQS